MGLSPKMKPFYSTCVWWARSSLYDSNKITCNIDSTVLYYITHTISKVLVTQLTSLKRIPTLMLVVWYIFEIHHFAIFPVSWHRHQRCQRLLLMWQHWFGNYVCCNVLLVALISFNILDTAELNATWVRGLRLFDRNKGPRAAPLSDKYCRSASTGHTSQFVFPR